MGKCVFHKKISPSYGWEIAKAGIHVHTGKLYRIESREKSFGAFLGGEDTWSEISQSDFCFLTGRDDINEDNSLSFVPDELKQKHAVPKLDEEECEFNGTSYRKRKKHKIAYLSVVIGRKFGTDTVKLYRYKDGYRAIYEYYSLHFPRNTTSRHLSETEAHYIIDVFPKKKPKHAGKNGRADISIYSGERILSLKTKQMRRKYVYGCAPV